MRRARSRAFFPRAVESWCDANGWGDRFAAAVRQRVIKTHVAVEAFDGRVLESGLLPAAPKYHAAQRATEADLREVLGAARANSVWGLVALAALTHVVLCRCLTRRRGSPIPGERDGASARIVEQVGVRTAFGELRGAVATRMALCAEWDLDRICSARAGEKQWRDMRTVASESPDVVRRALCESLRTGSFFGLWVPAKGVGAFRLDVPGKCADAFRERVEGPVPFARDGGGERDREEENGAASDPDAVARSTGGSVPDLDDDHAAKGSHDGVPPILDVDERDLETLRAAKGGAVVHVPAARPHPPAWIRVDDAHVFRVRAFAGVVLRHFSVFEALVLDGRGRAHSGRVVVGPGVCTKLDGAHAVSEILALDPRRSSACMSHELCPPRGDWRVRCRPGRTVPPDPDDALAARAALGRSSASRPCSTSSPVTRPREVSSQRLLPSGDVEYRGPEEEVVARVPIDGWGGVDESAKGAVRRYWARFPNVPDPAGRTVPPGRLCPHDSSARWTDAGAHVVPKTGPAVSVDLDESAWRHSWDSGVAVLVAQRRGAFVYGFACTSLVDAPLILVCGLDLTRCAITAQRSIDEYWRRVGLWNPHHTQIPPERPPAGRSFDDDEGAEAFVREVLSHRRGIPQAAREVAREGA